MSAHDSLDVYQDTVSRMEPEIHYMDSSACLPSIAISLKRIADGMDFLVSAVKQELTRQDEEDSNAPQ